MASTAMVVVQAGAVPVFADSDPRTFNIEPHDIERKITPNTKAIIPVCLFGLPADFDAINALATRHSLTVIEDDAQCFMATYAGRLAGTLARAASFSFQGSKHMTSGGTGGMVITDEEGYARLIRKAAILGYSTLDARPGGTMIPRDVRQDYTFERHSHFGYNFRMSAPQAALGPAQLERLEYLVAARRYIAGQYERAIREEHCDWLIPPYVPEGSTHSYWCYTCTLDTERLGVDWRSFRKTFIEHGGDGLYGLWAPVHLEPVFRNLSFHGSPSALQQRPALSRCCQALRRGRLPAGRGIPQPRVSVQDRDADPGEGGETGRGPEKYDSVLRLGGKVDRQRNPVAEVVFRGR